MSSASVLLLVVSAFLAAAGQLLLKIGAHERLGVYEFLNLKVFAGLMFYGIGVLIWIYVLSHEKLSNVYAFAALTFALVYLGAVVLIGEKLSITAVTGVVLIVAGIYLVVAHNPN